VIVFLVSLKPRLTRCKKSETKEIEAQELMLLEQVVTIIKTSL